ncbi:MAG: nitrile hydratase accessory protein, partial [Caulobacteraceae bacterium]
AYFERWLLALVDLIAEAGLARRGELDAIGFDECSTPSPKDPLAGSSGAEPGPPRFALGARVRARNMHPAGHTRLPRYARGRLGEVIAHRGAHILADASAHGRILREPLYGVRFAARELGEARPGRTTASSSIFGKGIWRMAEPSPESPLEAPFEAPFDAPWQAQAFALTLELERRGLFAWSAWTEALSGAIASAPERPYWESWLEALESLAARAGAAPRPAAEVWKSAWAAAFETTPHGQPVEPVAPAIETLDAGPEQPDGER